MTEGQWLDNDGVFLYKSAFSVLISTSYVLKIPETYNYFL
jgi:hypothetical protein